jgi:hypothetical protein
MLPLVVGSVWETRSGKWILKECPPGFYLSAQQCKLCPAMYYCIGGSLPSTACASGDFALPGATSEADCSASVFLVVTINLMINRPDFVDQTSDLLRKALANAAARDSAYIVVDIIQSGSDPRTTSVTSRVAFRNSEMTRASELVQIMDSKFLTNSFVEQGLGNPRLLSKTITACLAGYELSSTGTCQFCTPKYFCVGGTAGRKACPSGFFSNPGSNSSTACISVVTVLVSATLESALVNITSDKQTKFQTAVAQTARVSLERVEILINSRRIGVSAGQQQVNSEIAADNISQAQTISMLIDSSTLSSNLASQGLPKCSAVTVTITGANSQSIVSPQGSSGISILTALEGACGVFIFVVVCYLLRKYTSRRRSRLAFVKTLEKCKPKDPATLQHFPPEDLRTKDSSLQRQFTPDSVLGSGSRGCVLKAMGKNETSTTVAIKIIVPGGKKNRFDQKEWDRLKREADLLALVTGKQCRFTAVLASAAGSVLPERDDVSWLIMKDLDAKDSGNNLSLPLDDETTIQAARDILGALKVIHSEYWVHGDVNPANIIYCQISNGNPSDFKLVDFSSALEFSPQALKSLENESLTVTGEPEYRAPELRTKDFTVTPGIDIWSLGVTMFKFATMRMPDLENAGSNGTLQTNACAAVDAESKVFSAPDVLQFMPSLDKNLARAIKTALEINPADR